MRWAWVGLAIASTIGYLWMNPLIVVVWSRDEEEEDRMEPDRNGKVENLEDEEVGVEDVLMDTGVGDDDAVGA